MPWYRADVVFFTDRDEENAGQLIEDLLRLDSIHTKNLSVYEVCDLPSDAERAREQRQ